MSENSFFAEQMFFTPTRHPERLFDNLRTTDYNVLTLQPNNPNPQVNTVYSSSNGTNASSSSTPSEPKS